VLMFEYPCEEVGVLTITGPLAIITICCCCIPLN
jgi:hypothetical protein